MGTTPDDAVLAYLAQHRSPFLAEPAVTGAPGVKPTATLGESGSGPAADLKDVPGVPVLFPGISVPSDGWHCVDGTVDPGPLLKGVRTADRLWEEPAADRRAEPWPATAA